MAQVERFPRSHVGIGIDEDDFFDDAAELESESGVGPDAAAATDNGNLHEPNYG